MEAVRKQGRGQREGKATGEAVSRVQPMQPQVDGKLFHSFESTKPTQSPTLPLSSDVLLPPLRSDDSLRLGRPRVQVAVEGAVAHRLCRLCVRVCVCVHAKALCALAQPAATMHSPAKPSKAIAGTEGVACPQPPHLMWIAGRARATHPHLLLAHQQRRKGSAGQHCLEQLHCCLWAELRDHVATAHGGGSDRQADIAAW